MSTQSEIEISAVTTPVTTDTESVTKTYGSKDPETVVRSYTYESTNKNGKKVTKKVVRKYTNKKDTTNTLQNKTNKDIVEKNIRDNYNEIIALSERKRMGYIKEKCIPKDISASYNTIKALWTKIFNEQNVQPTVEKSTESSGQSKTNAEQIDQEA